MSYRFKRIWRQFRAGDAVPETFDAGTVGTMLERHIIEPAGEAPAAKSIDAPPADKSMATSRRAAKVSRKAVV